MEEEVTLINIYASNNFVGFKAPILENDTTVTDYMRTIAILEYVKQKLLEKLSPTYDD